MNKRICIPIALVLLMASLSGCNSFKAWMAQEFMQDKVSDGVARLSAQHMSMIVSELNPKFDSDAALVKIIPSADPAKGTVEWTVRNIEIDHPSEEIVYTDCQGQTGKWRGKVQITKATKTMFGRLTKDPKRPVLPDPGTIKIQVEAVPQNLSIRFPNKEGHLEMTSGHMKFSALPRLATQHSSGMRLTPTSNTKFENVEFRDIHGILTTKDVVMPVVINEASINVQIGEGEDERENSIGGTITIFGNKRSVPMDGKGLDPKYDAVKFRSTYACHPDLNGVIAFSHASIEEKLAHGVAGMSSSLMAFIAGALEDDTDCGMSNPGVMKATQIVGDPGQDGSAVSTLSKSCVLEFNERLGAPNCFGVAKEVHGSVSIMEASKTLRGVVVATDENYGRASKHYAKLLKTDKSVANANKPKAILPRSMQPAEFAMRVKLNDVTMRDVCLNEGDLTHPSHCKNRSDGFSAPMLKLNNAEIEARLKPLVAKSLDENNATANFCAQKTPAGEINITVENMHGSIVRSGYDLALMAKGSFSAVNGQIGDKENELRGSLSIGAIQFDFKKNDQDFLQLDPNYERKNFLDSFMSCQKLAMVNTDAECAPEQGLAVNVARLLVMNAGSLLKIAASSEVDKSFSSKNALATSELSADENTVKLIADIDQDLHLEEEKYKVLASSFDNANNNTIIAGQVKSLKGEMKRTGMRIHQPAKIFGINLNPASYKIFEGVQAKFSDMKEVLVRPLNYDSTTIELRAHVRDFTTLVKKHGREEPEPRISLAEAIFDIKATPFFGIDARTIADPQPSYSISTPVVKFNSIKVKNAPLVFKGLGMTIPIYLRDAQLTAHNGRLQGQGNYIEGNLVLSIVSDRNHVPQNGETVVIPRRTLMPESSYDQARFDESYRATKYLHAVLPAQ